MSLSAREEHELYLTNREAWAEYAAPKWVQMLRDSDSEKKKYLWEIAGAELRAALRRLAEGERNDPSGA